MLEIGSVVDGKYKILNKIGQGGMSIVYLAMNERANKQWAIKEVRKDGVRDYEVVKQGLVAEIDMLKRLNHPNLPSIIDVIEENGAFLIVMDYIEGTSLMEEVKRHGLPGQDKLIDWAKQLCDVLGYLHTREPAIIYRDMKPANVMLKPDGKVMLIDFGTAREFKRTSVEDTTCLGTRGYAAPEQYGGQGQTDARTDIYCLGATLYHLLTGQNPSEPPYEMYPIRQWNENLSSGLEEIILKCTMRNPEERYQSCAELLYALEHYTDLDVEEKKKRINRLRGFVVCAVMSVLFTGAVIAARGMELRIQSNSYDVLMREAETSDNMQEKQQSYLEAIMLDPARQEAYMGLLNDALLADNDFSEEDSKVIRQAINGRDKRNEANIEYLKRKEIAYSAFAYDLGNAYFYDYQGEAAKGTAASWYEQVVALEVAGQKEMTRAKKLGTIAGYYSQLDNTKSSGDTEASYFDFWNDLVLLTEGNLVKMDNCTTALRTYRELVSQVASNANKFKAAQITRSDIENQLDYIQEKLGTDVASSPDAVSENNVKLIRQIEGALEAAKRALDINFGTKDQGVDE